VGIPTACRWAEFWFKAIEILSFIMPKVGDTEKMEVHPWKYFV
jgi:hypothetical protein